MFSGQTTHYGLPQYGTNDELNVLGDFNETMEKIDDAIYEASRSSGGGGGGYELPIASASTLGGVKVGDTLEIDGEGVLNAKDDGKASIKAIRFGLSPIASLGAGTYQKVSFDIWHDIMDEGFKPIGVISSDSYNSNQEVISSGAVKYNSSYDQYTCYLTVLNPSGVTYNMLTMEVVILFSTEAVGT